MLPSTIISIPRAPRARPLRWPLLPLLGAPAGSLRPLPPRPARSASSDCYPPARARRCVALRCAAASASPGADERGWALALACLPACRAWFLRCPGLSSSTGYGGGSSFTPPPDLKLSSLFFFFSCDQAKKKRKKTKPGSSNIIRFLSSWTLLRSTAGKRL